MILPGCMVSKVRYQEPHDNCIEEIMNQAIMDGFFDNDLSRVPEGTYFLKTDKKIVLSVQTLSEK